MKSDKWWVAWNVFVSSTKVVWKTGWVGNSVARCIWIAIPRALVILDNYFEVTSCYIQVDNTFFNWKVQKANNDTDQVFLVKGLCLPMEKLKNWIFWRSFKKISGYREFLSKRNQVNLRFPTLSTLLDLSNQSLNTALSFILFLSNFTEISLTFLHSLTPTPFPPPKTSQKPSKPTQPAYKPSQSKTAT